MSGVAVLLNLAGAIALLLWATRMVRTGVERALGAHLRRWLDAAFRSRVTAAGSGLLMALMLQSSTAVVLMVSGFAGAGYLSLSSGIAAAAGADLGSALIVAILQVDLSLLVPLLLIAGMFAFRTTADRQWRQWGRILIGLGLLLLSLRLIGDATAAMRDAGALSAFLGLIGADWPVVMLLAAIATYLFHSSVAAVLLAAVLARQAVLPEALILPVVLGINLGGASIALVLTRGAAPAARAVPMANVMLRAGALMIVLAVAALVDPLAAVQGAGPAMRLIVAHVGFNVLVVVLGLVLAGRLAAGLERIGGPRRGNGVPATPSALSEADLGSPHLAVQNALRELVVLTGRVEALLLLVPAILRRAEADDVTAARRLASDIADASTALKSYLTRAAAKSPGGAQDARMSELLTVAVRFDRIGGIVADKIVARATAKAADGLDFSPEGWTELNGLYEAVMISARLAFAVLLSGDLATAERLAAQKTIVRELEATSARRHMDRLRDGRMASFATSALHMDVLQELKEINSLLVTLAYPLLEAQGLLRNSRIKGKARA